MLLNDLESTIRDFVSFFQQEFNFDNIFIGDWTAKQVFMHITFWHDSFARNVRDLALVKKPKILRGTYSALNACAFKELGQLRLPELASRLNHAQKIIHKYILKPDLPMIPYKAGSRDYSPEEHLEIVHLHIQGHLRDLRKVLLAKPTGE